MIVDKNIETLIEELGGYVALRELVVANVGDWGIERIQNGKSTFDDVSELIMGRMRKLEPERARDFTTPYVDSLLDIFEEALANSAGHGNKKNPYLPVSVRILECRGGYIIRIRDSGEGFDPENIALKRMRGEPGSSVNMGEGFRLFMETNVPVSFERRGTEFNMVIYKNEG